MSEPESKSESGETMATEVREAHLRAYLRGENNLMPEELRAVVRAAIKARDEEIQRLLKKLPISLW